MNKNHVRTQVNTYEIESDDYDIGEFRGTVVTSSDSSDVASVRVSLVLSIIPDNAEDLVEEITRIAKKYGI